MKRNCKNKNIQREKKDKKKQKLVNVELSFFLPFFFLLLLWFSRHSIAFLMWNWAVDENTVESSSQAREYQKTILSFQIL